jgi:hypothetical protein
MYYSQHSSLHVWAQGTQILLALMKQHLSGDFIPQQVGVRSK